MIKQIHFPSSDHVSLHKHFKFVNCACTSNDCACAMNDDEAGALIPAPRSRRKVCNS